MGCLLQTQNANAQKIIDFKKFDPEKKAWGDKIYLGKGNKDSSIYCYYYNNGGSQTALVMAGVHGSEWGGVQVVEAIKNELDKLNPAKVVLSYRVILYPKIFPYNVQLGKTNAKCSNHNKGRLTTEVSPDPNRQMPDLAAPFDKSKPLIATFAQKGKPSYDNIEVENQYLLQMVQKLNPDRIASFHCTNTATNQGVFADPRTNPNQIAFGFAPDSMLAVKIALLCRSQYKILQKGDDKQAKNLLLGNFAKLPAINTLYPFDKPIALKGNTQMRAIQYRHDHLGLGVKGISFGAWSSTEIKAVGFSKKASSTLTIELPHFCGKSEQEKATIAQAYTYAIIEGFLK